MAKKEKISRDIAIVSLLINILILPGLGSLIGGKTDEGIIQLILFLIGIPLSFILIGIPLIISMWIWALITGIKLIQEAK
ncbi:MAG: hypothetical protein QW117_00615 [Candidatus Pacearchaeota archaeon]